MTTSLAAGLDGSDLALGVRTVDGRPVGHIPAGETTDVVWSRESSEVSRCEITTFDVDAGELLPWLHWLDVWERDEVVWSGPIQEAGTDLSTGQTRIEVRDVGAFQWYTRVPTTRRWSKLDPAPIAADLWAAMLELHGVNATPQLLPAVGAERFDFAVTADSRMLHQTMDELVRLGLHWTVVAGRPILGNQPEQPFETLDEGDFMVALRRVRSGKRTAADVRVQGKNWAHTERVGMAGLKLQALISMDDMFGVSNITAASRQYLREVGSLRDVLEVPSGASLHPDAPLTTADLVPGRALTVHTSELSTLMRLKSVEVAWSGQSRDVRVTLDAVTPPIELTSAGTGAI